MKRNIANFVIIALFSFAGGFAAQFALGVSAVHAQQDAAPPPALPSGVMAPTGAAGYASPAPSTNAPESYRASLLQVFDATNPRGIQSFINKEGQSTEVFFGQDGKVRLQLGTYGDRLNRGMPLVSLNDSSGHVRFLVRLLGDNQSPVIFMKDNVGKDRLIMGLSPTSPGQEPFISAIDSAGKVTNLVPEPAK